MFQTKFQYLIVKGLVESPGCLQRSSRKPAMQAEQHKLIPN